MENPIKMDDLGVPTPIFGNIHILKILKVLVNVLLSTSHLMPPISSSFFGVKIFGRFPPNVSS